MTLSPERYREIEDYLARRGGRSKESRMLLDTFQALEELEYWVADAREVVKKTLHVARLMQLEQVAKTCEGLLS